MRINNQTQMYNLIWIVNGIEKETVLRNKPIAICKWKANILKSTTHRTGLLQPKKVNANSKSGITVAFHN